MHWIIDIGTELLAQLPQLMMMMMQ